MQNNNFKNQSINDARNFQKEIIQILCDDVVFFRIEEAMFKIHNIFQPDKMRSIDSEWTHQFYGYSTAFLLMGVDGNDDICSILSDIAYDMKSESGKNALTLARNIYYRWMIEINNYNSLIIGN